MKPMQTALSKKIRKAEQTRKDKKEEINQRATTLITKVRESCW
jgi:hypothetical protein